MVTKIHCIHLHNLEKVVILDDPPQNTLRQLLWDNTRVILVAHGIVKAGIDLGK